MLTNMPLRENLHEAGYKLVQDRGTEIVVVDLSTDHLELWSRCDGVASYAIVHKGHDYEFVREI